MKKCHFIGIGGIGMSGLARLMLSRNFVVTGSDLSTSYLTEGLAQAGAKVLIGHSAQHVEPDTTVIYSSDIKIDNPEYQAALRLQCPLLHRSDLLIELMSGYKTLAVTGTHGKTTTSALLAAVLTSSGLDPTFAVGGLIASMQCNSRHGQGEYFVAEADESDGTFLKYHPFGAIITNIDLDHMNHFGTELALVEAFQNFAGKVTSSKHLFWCGDDTRLRGLGLPGTSYGLNKDCQLRAHNFSQKGWGLTFDVEFQGKIYSQVEVALVGRHNCLNALAVFGLALTLDIPENVIRHALLTFKGVKRRCEKIGEFQGILLLDDYAHHPTELATTLRGIRSAIGERRLVAVFQPHRYSRTKDCLGSYAGIFDAADSVFMTDIYAAGEALLPNISTMHVLDEVSQKARIPCCYVPRHELDAKLTEYLRPHDVLVILGAGDITKLGPSLLKSWQKAPPKKLRVGVIYGGCSTEHEISLLSARYVYQSLQTHFYDVHHFGITKQGTWRSGGLQPLSLLEENATSLLSPIISPEILNALLECDVLFPVLHGSFGEDGTIQGMFEMLGKPYVGCDHRSAAVCMDKVLTKKLVIAKGIATAAYTDFSRYEWETQPDEIRQRICQDLQCPIFVKPIHGGSSIGVSKVESIEQLDDAIQNALRVDTHLVVEDGINGREIEFAVLGNDEITVFPPGEICNAGKIYDYQSKYGTHGMSTMEKADLSPELIKTGMELAKSAYSAAGCTGYARVDFFLDKSDKFWFNEINPIPGFTQISLYPKICAANGLSIQDLVDRLILLAMRRHRQKTPSRAGM